MIHGTMTRAADLRGISQPAVSNMMASLARELGFALFVKSGGRLRPTPEAKLFFEEANRALEALDNTSRIAEEIRMGRRGHLSIAAYPSISISLLPRLISVFAADRPDLHVKLLSRNSQGVRDLFSSQQFDIAIAELPLDYPASQMEIFTYECECMMAVDHPLALKQVITPRDLDGAPFVTLFRGDPIYQQLAIAFSQYEARWNIVAETEYFATACELVSAGCGVGVIDPVVSTPFTANIVKRKFVPLIEYRIAILHPSTDARSQIVEDFLELLRSHLTL